MAQSVARAIRDICTTVLEPSSDAIHQVVRGLDEYLHVGYQFGITALFVLLCEALFLRHRFDVALEVIEQGIQVRYVTSIVNGFLRRKCID